MIDIANKEITQREAIVEGELLLKPVVVEAIKKKKIPKGDVLAAARFAGILAAKNTPELIPLCHPISLEYVELHFSLYKNKIKIQATVRAQAKTGVEMEAFVATAISALTIYDMCKPLDRAISISEMKLLKKSGGKSGTYIRNVKFKNQNAK
jgi:cyclic pyranopterin phosphate synthase